MIGMLERLREKKRREAAARESRKMRDKLVDMICAMNEEQFTWFVQQACEQIPELCKKYEEGISVCE